MPNMDAVDEIEEIIAELAKTNIDKLQDISGRLREAFDLLGAARPATSREVGDRLRHRKQRALEMFHKWNDVTGFVPKGISYEGELESIIEDAVEVGYYGRPVTNADDWDEITEPGGPSGIRKADSRDGE
jgi:hypothetical protein